MFHLVIRPVTETQQHDAQVGVIERLEARIVVARVRVDLSCLLIDREQHRALEAVSHRKNFRQHRQPFLRPILLVARDQHDVFAFARPALAFVRDPVSGE